MSRISSSIVFIILSLCIRLEPITSFKPSRTLTTLQCRSPSCILMIAASHDGLVHATIRQVASGMLAASCMMGTMSGMPLIASAESSAEVQSRSGSTDDTIAQVPLYTKKSSDLQQYTDLPRGFRMLRPFGWNEFDGAGAGYAVKFASLISVDDNIVVGSAPASAGKTSIADYGSLDALGSKLASKRGGTVVSAVARETEGTLFYQFQFENPLDPSLPRTGPKNNRPTKGVELYQLCVAKGRLWSVQATSNDRDYPDREKLYNNVLQSFLPRA